MSTILEYLLFVLFRLKLKTYKPAYFHRALWSFFLFVVFLAEINHVVFCLLKLMFTVTLRILKSVASLKIRETSSTGLKDVVIPPQLKQGRLMITLSALPLVSQYSFLFKLFFKCFLSYLLLEVFLLPLNNGSVSP